MNCDSLNQALKALIFFGITCFTATVTIAQGQATRIGVLLPLSGPGAESGADQLRGMQTALAGVGTSKAVELIAVDDRCQPDVGRTLAQRLAEVDRIVMLVGAPCTSTSVADYAERARIPFLSTGAPGLEQRSVTFQLGVSRERVARLAKELAAKTGLKVDDSSACLWTYRPFIRDGFVASLCPSLGVEHSRWQSLRKNYIGRFNAEPAATAVIGFAAMQIVLETRNAQANSRDEIVKILSTQRFETILGSMKFGGSESAPSTLRVISATSATSEAKNRLAAETTNGGCDNCKKGGECPQGSAKALRYAAEDDCCKKSKTGECPQGSLLFLY